MSNITPNTEDENRNSLDLALSVSPNPTSDQIVVSLVGDVYLVKSYQLISIDGKIVVSGTIDSETDLKLILDLTESAHGMYSVVFYDMNDRSLLSERIIKK